MCLGAAAVGGYQPAQDNEKTSRLAAFSVDQIAKQCAASNSFACSRASELSPVKVLKVEQQVVAGVNYRIAASTPSGTVNLIVFEQAWTKTLEVVQATLAVPPAGASLAIETLALIDSPLSLDAAAFAAYKL